MRITYLTCSLHTPWETSFFSETFNCLLCLRSSLPNKINELFCSEVCLIVWLSLWVFNTLYVTKEKNRTSTYQSKKLSVMQRHHWLLVMPLRTDYLTAEVTILGSIMFLWKLLLPVERILSLIIFWFEKYRAFQLPESLFKEKKMNFSSSWNYRGEHWHWLASAFEKSQHQMQSNLTIANFQDLPAVLVLNLFLKRQLTGDDCLSLMNIDIYHIQLGVADDSDLTLEVGTHMAETIAVNCNKSHFECLQDLFTSIWLFSPMWSGQCSVSSQQYIVFESSSRSSKKQGTDSYFWVANGLPILVCKRRIFNTICCLAEVNQFSLAWDHAIWESKTTETMTRHSGQVSMGEISNLRAQCRTQKKHG